MKRFVFLLMGLFLLGEGYGVSKVGTVNLISEMPDYYATVKLAKGNGTVSFELKPCERRGWDPIGFCCKDESVSYVTYDELELVEIGPGIYVFEVGFELNAKDKGKDEFVRVQKSAIFKEYVNATEPNRASFLISAYGNEVLGILFESGEGGGRNVYLAEAPCGYWNKYWALGNLQNVYPGCGN